jgi:N utilization substance protein B
MALSSPPLISTARPPAEWSGVGIAAILRGLCGAGERLHNRPAIRYHDDMTRRSRAREVALQLLFARDHNPNVSRADIERFVSDRLREPALREFCLLLYDGTVMHLADIDRRLSEAAENWRLPRMAAIDRNVLRLGAQELLWMPDTPASVALDEAIELARRFGSADSPRFVNGVLDKLLQTRKAEGGAGGEEAPAPPPAGSAEAETGG